MDNKIYLYNDDDFDWADEAQAQADQEFEAECLADTIKSILKKYTIIATGVLGLWDGKAGAGAVIENWEDFAKLLQDYNKVYIENGEIKVEAVHHDGRNCFICRLLSDRGLDYWGKNWNTYQYDRKTVCEKLAKPPMSKKFNDKMLLEFNLA